MFYPRVVVSLSTIPTRLLHIAPTLESIAAQTYLPHVIYLNLCHTYTRIPERILPEDIDALLKKLSPLARRLLRINWREDYGPATKLIPAIQREDHPETIIITIDDDHIYRKDLVSLLVGRAKHYPDAALCFSGRDIIGFIGSINTFVYRDIRVDIVDGFGGVAYRRKFFLMGEEIIHPPYYLPEDAFYEDDFLVSAWLAYCRIPRIRIYHTGNVSKFYGEGKDALSKYQGLWGKSKRIIRCGYYMEENGFTKGHVPPFFGYLIKRFT